MMPAGVKVFEQLAIDVPGSVTIDDTQFALALAAAGGGLAYLPEPCVGPPVARGELRVVLPDWAPMGPGFHIYYPGRRQLPTGLRLLAGRPLRPALLWMDSRASAQAERTARFAATHPILAWSGGSDAAEWLLPKAMWL